MGKENRTYAALQAKAEVLAALLLSAKIPFHRRTKCADETGFLHGVRFAFLFARLVLAVLAFILKREGA